MTARKGRGIEAARRRHVHQHRRAVPPGQPFVPPGRGVARERRAGRGAPARASEEPGDCLGARHPAEASTSGSQSQPEPRGSKRARRACSLSGAKSSASISARSGSAGPRRSAHSTSTIARAERLLEPELGQLRGEPDPVEVGVPELDPAEVVGLHEGEARARHLLRPPERRQPRPDQRAREMTLAGAEAAGQPERVPGYEPRRDGARQPLGRGRVCKRQAEVQLGSIRSRFSRPSTAPARPRKTGGLAQSRLLHDGFVPAMNYAKMTTGVGLTSKALNAAAGALRPRERDASAGVRRRDRSAGAGGGVAGPDRPLAARRRRDGADQPPTGRLSQAGDRNACRAGSRLLPRASPRDRLAAAADADLRGALRGDRRGRALQARVRGA